MDIGVRVGAIYSASPSIVCFLGFGVYQGDFVPPRGPNSEPLSFLQIPVPKILLDSGEVVYGHQCYFASEYDVKQYLQGKHVVDVDLKDVLGH